MTRDDIRPGDTLRDLSIRGAGRTVEVVGVQGHHILARGADGRVRTYLRTAIHTDGRPRRCGYAWEPREAEA